MLPPQRVGMPCFWVFSASGYPGGRAAAVCASRPGSVPPGVMLMRLSEYANSRSFTIDVPMVDVNRSTICLDGCAQLLSSTGHGSSPQRPKAALPLGELLVQLSWV